MIYDGGERAMCDVVPVSTRGRWHLCIRSSDIRAAPARDESTGDHSSAGCCFRGLIRLPAYLTMRNLSELNINEGGRPVERPAPSNNVITLFQARYTYYPAVYCSSPTPRSRGNESQRHRRFRLLPRHHSCWLGRRWSRPRRRRWGREGRR